MASRPYATTARCLCATLVKASATVVVALCLAFKLLRPTKTTALQTVVPIQWNMYCVVGNKQDPWHRILCVGNRSRKGGGLYGKSRGTHLGKPLGKKPW